MLLRLHSSRYCSVVFTFSSNCKKKKPHFFCFCFPQVLREEEFAPVKNANGSNFDTPESAKLLVLRLHTRWVIAAGGFLTHSVPLYATGKEPIQLFFFSSDEKDEPKSRLNLTIRAVIK